jgi:uncharacterized membrane protein required for colicin V production
MVIDIIFVIAAGYGFYLGFSRGIIRTVFTVLSLLFGLMAAFKFAPAATRFLETAFNNTNPLMFIAGFLLSFVLTMIIIRLIARALEGVLKTANINILNQFAGGVLLSGMMVLIYSLLLWFAQQSHILDEDTKDGSFTYTYLQHFPEQVWNGYEYIKPTFQEFWDESVFFMDRLQKMSVERSEDDANIFDLDETEPEAEPTNN